MKNFFQFRLNQFVHYFVLNYSDINIAINFRKNYSKLKMKYEKRGFRLLLYWLHCHGLFRPFEMAGILLFRIFTSFYFRSFVHFSSNTITMNHESVSTHIYASPVYRAFNVIQRKHWFVWPGYTHVRFKQVSLEKSQFCSSDHSIYTYIDAFLHATIIFKKKKKRMH